ncbi:rhomboid family intramembrane serine protease [Hymenobacter gummosus]|uniref:Rhomboid family intramembrane serine protease n=1 Tax=Hymenobacter gummosus TaxID=1776032 RepID=A0A3S0HIS9_9BACT|nr:rhomboid family intramembrane serine protease [Hymenobacter gummosus]RTQ44750.1 rhomboid family intramembrane serine protease [Hymenobacter gummosus]
MTIQFTPMVRNLLFVNAAVFLLASMGALGGLTPMLALFPWTSDLFQPFQHFTYMFMHGGMGHLFSNMLALLIFGPQLENHWGGQRFLVFWLACGIGAGVLYQGVRHYETEGMRQARDRFVAQPTAVNFADFYRDHAPAYAPAVAEKVQALRERPDDAALVQNAKETVVDMYDATLNTPNGSGMVGASGAVFGVLLAFGYLFSHTPLQPFLFPFPIKAAYFVFLYGMLELYSGIHPVPNDNVAHFAHLGGMLFGFLLLKFWEQDRSRFY